MMWKGCWSDESRSISEHNLNSTSPFVDRLQNGSSNVAYMAVDDGVYIRLDVWLTVWRTFFLFLLLLWVWNEGTQNHTAGRIHSSARRPSPHKPIRRGDHDSLSSLPIIKHKAGTFIETQLGNVLALFAIKKSRLEYHIFCAYEHRAKHVFRLHPYKYENTNSFQIVSNHIHKMKNTETNTKRTWD